MTNAATRALLGAALLLLAGCGGSSDEKTSLGGRVSGLQSGTSVSIQNNGTETLTLNSNGPFHFKGAIPAGGAYNVTVVSQPAGGSCSVANGSGRLDAQGDPVDNVVVNCAGTAPPG